MSDGFSDALMGSNVISNNSEVINVKLQDNRTTTIVIEGMKHDENKPRLELIPSSLLDAVGNILTMGAKKYADNNWRKGLKYTRVLGALIRHLNAWRECDSIDKESGMSHLWHVACNAAFLIEFEAHPEKYKDFDDRWNK